MVMFAAARSELHPVVKLDTKSLTVASEHASTAHSPVSHESIVGTMVALGF